MRKAIAAVTLALMMVPFMGAAASASTATDKVECLFRVYIQEGGESGLDCLT